MPEFDFAYFHPLDHAIWERRCWDTPGGPRNHIALWWRHQVDLIGPIRRRLFCPLDRHRGQPFWLGLGLETGFADLDEPTGYDCQDCGIPLT